MGLEETYRLPRSYNEAYHLTGDGVAVPVVRFLAHYLFEPLLNGNPTSGEISADDHKEVASLGD